jgi:pimeloyl-ACP methyl ester carboxylesterase
MKKVFYVVLFFFSFVSVARADYPTVFVQISSNGNVPPLTISCAQGHDYTSLLVHQRNGQVIYSYGIVDRLYCKDGLITFAGFNLNNKLLFIDQTWWRWVATPLEYVVKDTTGIGYCNEFSCNPISLENPVNNYDHNVELSSSDFYHTAAAGPVFDTSDYATWFNRDNIFLDVSADAKVVTIRSLIENSEVGAFANFKISDSSGAEIFRPETVVATTSGEFYYSFNIPTLTDPKTTKPKDFVFHADISNGDISRRIAEKTLTLSSSVLGYPGYSNFGDDAVQYVSDSYSHFVQTLGKGISGELTQVDIKTRNLSDSYYGSRSWLEMFECDSDSYGKNFLDLDGCRRIYSGLTEMSSKVASSVQSFYFDLPVVFDPSKYYVFSTQGNNQFNVLPEYYGSSADNVDGSCYQVYLANVWSPCANIADLYFYMRGVSKQIEPPSAVCTENCFSNVLFLPGIEASRLYAPAVLDGQSENRLWEPDNDTDVENLFMDESGRSVDGSVYTKEVIDDAYGVIGIYGAFIEKLEKMKTDGNIADYSAVPYDWRLSLDDILNGGTKSLVDGKTRISYLTATSSPYIESELRRLVRSSKSGKVTIVAHSNGGLVAKSFLKKLEKSQDPLLAKIDKLILVAVPQLGTPEAIAADLHGYQQDIPAGKLSEHKAREFAQNAPPAYNLLPDQNYFTYVDTPAVTFDTELSDWVSHYGQVIHSEELLNNFLTDTYGRTSAAGTDIKTPVALNTALLQNARDMHDSLDSWQIPDGINVIEIAGWGIPTTVSGINYIKESESGGIAPVMNTTVDGDGTVTTPSALWSGGREVERYWVDLGQYNKDHPLSQVPIVGRLFVHDHKNILEISSLNNFILDKIKNDTKSISYYEYFSTESPPNTNKRLSYSLHSPLTLNIYDDYGRHTGISTTTGDVEEEIPGTYYTELAGTKYIFTDTSLPSHIIMNGYDSGTFTFKVNEMTGDVVVASTTFRNIPTTNQTKASIDIESDITTLSPMILDEDGNGTVDFVLKPKENGIKEMPKPLTVMADNKNLILGSPVPTLITTLFGFVDNKENDVSGSASCSTTYSSQSPVGKYPVVCSAGSLYSDNYFFSAFNPGVINVGYRFDGFLQPINDTVRNSGQIASIFKGGSTVPVKLQLKNNDGVSVKSVISPIWLSPQKGSAMNLPVDESVYSDTATVGTEFKWDATNKQYIYNWSTKGLATGYWYKISVKLDDGNIYSVTIGLK